MKTPLVRVCQEVVLLPLNLQHEKGHDIPLDIQNPMEFAWNWKLDIMPKLKIFLRRISRNALATHSNLLKRGLNLDPSYPLHHSQLDSIATSLSNIS